MNRNALGRLGLIVLLPVAACGSGGAHEEEDASVDVSGDGPGDSDRADGASDGGDPDGGSADGSGGHSAELRSVACGEIAALTAFDVGWANMNHRISRLAVGLDRGQSIASDHDDGSGSAPAEGSGATVTDARLLNLAEPPVCAAPSWVTTFVGGDFTTGAVAEDNAEIALASVRVALPDGARAWVVEVPTTIGPSGHATGTLDLTSLSDFDAGQNVVAFVQGFAFDTDVPQTAAYGDGYDPALGYTSRGFGAGVAVSDDRTQLEWRLRFENGVSFDALFRGDMNAAIAHAQVGATLEVAVLALDPQVSVQTAQVAWLQQTSEPYRTTEEREPDVDSTLRAVSFSGATDGFAVLSSFDLRLYPDSACATDRDCDSGDICVDGSCAFQTGLPGDYVRQLSAGIESVTVGDDAATVLVRGYASTASEAFAFRPLRHEFAAEVLWIGLPAGSRATGSTTGPAGTHRIEVVP